MPWHFRPSICPSVPLSDVWIYNPFADRRDVGSSVGFPAEFNFYHRGFRTRTVVAHNPCVSWAFLLIRLETMRICSELNITHYARTYLRVSGCLQGLQESL